MKAQIESQININTKFTMSRFRSLIAAIIDSDNEKELREEMNNMELYEYEYGFGSNHMWVHQKIGNKVLKDRLLFVEF